MVELSFEMAACGFGALLWKRARRNRCDDKRPERASNPSLLVGFADQNERSRVSLSRRGLSREPAQPPPDRASSNISASRRMACPACNDVGIIAREFFIIGARFRLATQLLKSACAHEQRVIAERRALADNA